MKCQTNQFNCPVEATLSLIGGKYKPLILWHLIDQPYTIWSYSGWIPNATPKDAFCSSFMIWKTTA